MSMEKNILGIVPGLQATALVAENLKMFKMPKKGKPAKLGPKKIIKTGVTNLLGIGLIGPTASMINAMD